MKLKLWPKTTRGQVVGVVGVGLLLLSRSDMLQQPSGTGHAVPAVGGVPLASAALVGAIGALIYAGYS